MGLPVASPRSRVPWALALAVGLSAGLAGYVIHAALVKRIPKQTVQVRLLTDLVGWEESPALSPDGKTVAFVAASGGRRQIWIQPLGDGTPRAITMDDTDHFAPRWSADSSTLIYFAAGAIWEISAMGGGARKLADALAPGDLNHEGRDLAFFRREDRGAELVAGTRTFATITGGGVYSNLRWSPDDKKIAYLRDGELMVAALSGGEPVPAAGGHGTIQGFAWTPDNSGLIVSSDHGNLLAGPPVFNLWFIPRTDSSSSQLTFGELSYESPDINKAGNLVVSRKSLFARGTGEDSDIVMFSGLKWKDRGR